jgi:hypothetical protein
MSDDQVLGWLRDQLDRRRQAAAARDDVALNFVPGAWQPGSQRAFTPALYGVLEEANNCLCEVADVRLVTRPSNLPVLGPWIDRAKRPVHDLVLVYVRELARRVLKQHWRLIRILNETVEAAPRQQLEEMDRLRERIDRLERELDALRAQQSQTSQPGSRDAA